MVIAMISRQLFLNDQEPIGYKGLSGCEELKWPICGKSIFYGKNVSVIVHLVDERETTNYHSAITDILTISLVCFTPGKSVLLH